MSLNKTHNSPKYEIRSFGDLAPAIQLACLNPVFDTAIIKRALKEVSIPSVTSVYDAAKVYQRLDAYLKGDAGVKLPVNNSDLPKDKHPFRLEIVDEKALKCSKRMLPTLEGCVDYLTLLKDDLEWQVKQGNYNLARLNLNVYIDKNCSKLLKVLVEFLTPNGAWSERNAIALYRYGFQIMKPHTPSPYFYLGWDDVQFTVNFARGMF